ncbi:replication-associated recombination protein A [Carnobacteriaceae bacterium zg-84]|uniref:replication-associated recombination protein A n=1 Tax=Granulicatella sp. zg-84 TaxID=2678503 RepID=UPI0013BF0E1F|nr:replication-associated recombination protein A [Granulicatella sp. zg-84]NEW66101.1 AAA family ATPase [Granulicatella sp. zg-84]QMI85458.1 replication-associated recombination protein A [Carnobacteriaceae bacterium zg-84]
MVKPLAFRMRPTHIDDIVGQEHLVGQNKIIRRMVNAKRLSSMILYGPPGIGKTSIASAIAGSTQYAFRILNAATDGKKDLEVIVEEAKLSGTVILLLDEIHRLNKVKQDFLLPHLEKGSIILIGATTENPYISINPAIRSRTQLFELYPLSSEDIKKAIYKTLSDTKDGLGNYAVNITEDAVTFLATATHGDLRRCLNALELAVLSTQKNADNTIDIDTQVISECLQQKVLVHDKDGDAHYDTISAFQKSIRGSDVDASLHYLARLIQSQDLISIIRRLLVIAYEDIGLANPTAVDRTFNAVQVAERLGFPEARIPLSMAVIDLALSPKSNSSITAIDKALADLALFENLEIPAHLKDNHYKGANERGHGLTYKYPHHYPNHFVSQQYLPTTLQHQTYYVPGNTGKYEHQLYQLWKQYQTTDKE